MKEKNITKNSKKTFILLGTIVIALISIIVIVYLINNLNNKNNDPTNENKVINNKNEGVIKEQEIEGLSLTNTSLSYVDGLSILETTATNNNEEPYYLEEFHIIIKDEKGNDIINYEDEKGNKINYLVGYAGTEIPSKESIVIETSIDFDIASSAYTITYEVVK